MYITVYEGNLRLRICSREGDIRKDGLTSQARASQAVRYFVDDFQAEYFIRRHFGDPAEMYRLRCAVHADPYDIAGMSDSDLVRVAVRLLTSGRWRVFDEEQDTAPVAFSAQPAGTASTRAETFATPRWLAKERRAAQYSVTSAVPSQPSAHEVTAQAVGPVVDELLKKVSQAAQAATLVKAAEHGTPFCAICAAMAAARAAQIAAALDASL